jgi:hypothetical protein
MQAAPLSSFPEDDIKIFRLRVKERYRYFGRIRCPYFQGFVSFNSNGFQRFCTKSWNRGRSRAEKLARLKLVAWAPEVIRLTRTAQAIRKQVQFERVHRAGRWEKRLVPVSYYLFQAIFENQSVKVIVKQVQNGPPFFWAVIPASRKDRVAV